MLNKQALLLSDDNYIVWFGVNCKLATIFTPAAIIACNELSAVNIKNVTNIKTTCNVRVTGMLPPSLVRSGSTP